MMKKVELKWDNCPMTLSKVRDIMNQMLDDS